MSSLQPDGTLELTREEMRATFEFQVMYYTIRNGTAKEKTMDKVNLAQKFNLFQEYWSPKIVGELNDSYVKLAKLKGEFVWHHHDTEDELFLVIKGRLLIKLRDRDILLEEGEFVIIPRGVDHLPIAEEEAHVLLLEPKTTLNTGNTQNERTVIDLERI
jgi:mannose-6-phosphate isomerase-like protein (cupin superfamily)